MTGDPSSIDTTAGGVSPAGTWPNGYVPGSANGGYDSGACYDSAGKCQFRQADPRRHVRALLVERAPQRVQRLQPPEQRGVRHRRKRTREVLVQVVVVLLEQQEEQEHQGKAVLVERVKQHPQMLVLEVVALVV